MIFFERPGVSEKQNFQRLAFSRMYEVGLRNISHLVRYEIFYIPLHNLLHYPYVLPGEDRSQS